MSAYVDVAPRRAAGPAPARHRTEPPRRPRRRRWVVPLVLLVVVLVWAGWLAVDAAKARRAMAGVAELVAVVRADVVAGDDAAVRDGVAEAQELADEAVAATRGPHWAAASVLPWVGPNVRAVRTAADVVDDLTAVLPELPDVAAAVDHSRLAPVDGRVDLAPLVAAAPRLATVEGEVRGAQDRLAAAASSDLWPVVARPLDRLRLAVDDVAMLTATASRVTRLAPPMLGADGPRRYLVLVQDSAQPRATGGAVRAVVVVRAEDGAVTVESAAPAPAEPGMLEGTGPAVEPTPAEVALFGDGRGGSVRDATFTPDFPRAAGRVAALWSPSEEALVDGVLAVDAGALARVLEVTGAVSLGDGTQVSATGAESWFATGGGAPDAAAADQRVAEAAAAVVGAVARGGWEPGLMVHALAAAARDGRLLLWSAHDDEQALLAGTVLAGELRGEAGRSPVVGVFLDVPEPSSLAQHLAVHVLAATTQCRPDGAREVLLDLSLSLDAPLAVTGQPAIAGVDPAAPDELQVGVVVSGPTGGRVEGVDVESLSDVVVAVQGDLPLVGAVARLDGGDPLTARYRVTIPGQEGPLVVRATPGVSVEVPARSC